MQHFAEEYKVVPLLTAQTVSSVAATDVINMSEYDKVTFLVTTATVTVGANVSFRQMDSVADTVASESRVGIDYYWEQGGSASDTYTKNSADSISSAGGITIANGDDSRVFIAELRGSQLSSSNNCVALYVDDSTANMAMEVLAICHPRYKQASPPTALA